MVIVSPAVTKGQSRVCVVHEADITVKGTATPPSNGPNMLVVSRVGAVDAQSWHIGSIVVVVVVVVVSEM